MTALKHILMTPVPNQLRYLMARSRLIEDTRSSVDADEGVADPDAVPLPEDDTDPVLFEAEVDVQRKAERLLGLLLGQVVVVVVDQAAGLGNNEDVVDAHGEAVRRLVSHEISSAQ